jgi:hypothetical protein
LASAVLLFGASTVRAQREFPTDKALVDAAATQLDRDTAALMMKRTEGVASPVLEMEIDLRIIERWLLNTASAAKAASEEQIIAQMRWVQLDRAILALDATLQQAPAAFSQSQKDAASRLHQLSYKLGDSPDAARVDATCRDVGTLMLLASNAVAQDPRKLPIMRPARLVALRSTTPVASTAEAAQPTVAQLTDAARRLAVSQTLRQQLLTLANTAAESARDPAHAKETATLTATLSDAVEIASGLAAGAVSEVARDQMDAQLSEGLALFSDARTRSAGETRIASMNQYRQVLERENRLRLTPEQRGKFASALAYAQANLDQSSKVLDLLEKFVVQSARLDALPKTPPSIPALKKSSEDVRTQCQQHRDAFYAASAIAPSASPAAATPTGPEAMEVQLNDLRQEIDLADSLQQMPAAIDVLQNTYKAKPFGALERKAIASAVAAASSQRSAARLEAIHALNDISHLASIAGPVPEKLVSEVPLSIAQLYAGGPLEKIAAKHALLISNTASQLALGQDVDKTTWSRIQNMRDLDNALRLSARFEAALGKWGDMTRWADVQFNADQLHAATAPLQSMMVAAYAGFMADTSASLDAFVKYHARYVPLMKLAVADASFSADCAALPGGLEGALSQLQTPLIDPHFNAERFTSYALPIMMSIDDANTDGNIVFDVSRLIRDQLHISSKLDDEVPAVAPRDAPPAKAMNPHG